MTDHCEHCLSGGEQRGQCSEFRHWSAMDAAWDDGKCQVCAEVAVAVAAERKRIVAWLGTLGLESGPKSWFCGLVYEQGEVVDWIAAAIERGEHLEDQ